MERRAGFKAWADQHLIVPRWLLTAHYILLGMVAAVGLAVGVPSLDFTTAETFAYWWCVLLLLAAGTGGVASARERWAVPERWAVLVVLALLGALAASLAIVATNARPTAWVSFAFVILTGFVPTCRLVDLLARIPRSAA